MLPGWMLLLALIGYAALLFGVAWLGDRHPVYPRLRWLRPIVYSLALAVYCSSWTFYGAVGTAARQGIGYLPIYLGPLLMLLFGWRILERMALIAQSQNTVSIADFLSARYGRSQQLAALVTVIALIAAVPYFALQFKAVATSLDVLRGSGSRITLFGDPGLYVAALMALFAILFGTREVDATEHRPGMMLAIALESLVKLVALSAVGVFAIGWLGTRDVPVVAATRALVDSAPAVGFVGQTLLAFAAIICLPRQFHVAVVECGDVADIRRARWLFGAYLVVICLMVLPIATAGVALFGHGSPIADSFVLALPLAENRHALAMLAYVGGFSAATGMVIVASVALATMVSNDIVMPLLLRHRRIERIGSDVASTVLWIRRAAIVMLAALAWGYYRLSASETALSAYGLMAFAAVAQFAPPLIGGLYWRGASRRGAEAGLLLGFGLWIYTLLLPALTDSGWFARGWIDHGPFAIGWLRPRQLFGLSGWDPLTHGTICSLLANIGGLLLGSMRWRPNLDERLRALPFLDPYAERRTLAEGEWSGNIQIDDLLTLSARVVGERTAQRAFEEQAATSGQSLQPGVQAGRQWIQFTERLLAAAVGAASARLMLTSVLRGSGMEVAEVVAVLDEAGQELRFNREILSNTLENIDQGVSVVDREMCLVAWNRRYQQLFGYPDGMLYVGRPVADLIRHNIERGQIGEVSEEDIEEQIGKRIGLMRAGSPHVTVRIRGDGRVIELRGQSLPRGGYVTSYSDITEHVHAQRDLREINETLEQRVSERTHEAEAAQESRSRFLTAVSHDVLQPLNAARLFASALRESVDPAEQRHLAERVDVSLRAAEELLDGLLDVSRLDAGALMPVLQDVDTSQLLHELAAQYAPMAAGRSIDIRVHAPRLFVRSDRRLLRRVLQNFLANALRYTPRGRIVLAARPRGTEVALQVWDTGPGIPEHHMRQIYDEFHRYEQAFDWDGRGMGLGLSICQRISRLLDHALDVRTSVGHGSMFSIRVPRVEVDASAPSSVQQALATVDPSLVGLRVLCVDNDADILAGMRALLGRWQVDVLCAATIDEALALTAQSPEVLLVDYHLHDRMDGLDTLTALQALCPDARGALLTADGSDALKQRARERHVQVLTKPVKPASLRAFLAARRVVRGATIA
ncbi:hybrid sensor histidine kinase/response regulator [Solilutibacter silvestris]|uniref:histidine kinase n=1 Tax=Solilutibacter silvestris TaxID=1645665 RepID=A0A2K1Q0P1_9GAMM|nr:PAS domain-containing hybrid sensor histidine kinase/response regulator [Lysobacter silvestris]PNS08615.1 S-box protein [Lysobacter silvestris]